MRKLPFGMKPEPQFRYKTVFEPCRVLTLPDPMGVELLHKDLMKQFGRHETILLQKDSYLFLMMYMSNVICSFLQSRT